MGSRGRPVWSLGTLCARRRLQAHCAAPQAACWGDGLGAVGFARCVLAGGAPHMRAQSLLPQHGSPPAVGGARTGEHALHARSQALPSAQHTRGTHVDLVVPEVLASVAELEKHGVGERLAGQRGARGPEGDGHAVLARQGQHQADLRLAVHLDHQLGVEAVEGGVRAVGEGPHGVGEHALLGHEGRDLRHEGRVPARAGGGGGGGRWPHGRAAVMWQRQESLTGPGVHPSPMQATHPLGVAGQQGQHPPRAGMRACVPACVRACRQREPLQPPRTCRPQTGARPRS